MCGPGDWTKRWKVGMNRAKQTGTKFESGLVRYLRSKTGDDRIRRFALSGSDDEGDVGGIYAHGMRGIAECKSHKSVTPALVARWKEETLRERGNADADFAALVVHVSGRDATGRKASFGQNRVLLTWEDAIQLNECADFVPGLRRACEDRWIETDVDGLVWLICGPGRGADGGC